MRLPGRLRTSTLGDILGTAYRERASGAVELVEASGRTHRVHLMRGLVTSVEIDRASPSLAEMLRRDEAVNEDVIRRSLLRALSARRLHGEVLVQDFQVSPSVVDLALRKQIQNRLHCLETLADAQVHFRVTVRVPRGALQDSPLDAPLFLHGRKRARDREVWSSSDRPSENLRVAQNDAARAKALRILGLRGDESVEEVKRVYRKLAVSLHPDAHAQGSEEEQREYTTRFQEVTRAYQTLVA